METETAVEQHNGPAEPKKAGSGYARLRNRHRRLIDEHEQLKMENAELLVQQQGLQADVERLLIEHQKLMQNVKAPPQAANWFETANLTLARLAVAPDPQAVRIFVSALAQLQSRISPIVARTPL